MEELPKTYEPKQVEQKWFRFWQDHHFFKADAKSKKPPFCIVMPPPNVTGVLHMGHALTNTLQDVLIRWKRMSGFEALWVPGTDHAGIATQTVVERHLIATTGKRRTAFSREAFLTHVWDWKEKSEKQILHQLESLGCSYDLSRLAFTMDEPRNRAVRTMFKKLFDAGLIYRGDYLVNWDPVTQTALADDEVEYEERETTLWHFRYPLEDKTGFITVATTRPETMLGDTAIAVSAQDPRYAQLIGKKAMLPLVNRPIPIIADPHVDPTFGSGAVKVTPAHDPNDYEIGLRHKLPMINILTPDGHLNENGLEWKGLSIEQARDGIVKRMQSLKLVEKSEPHKHRVGLSYRSKAVIEPYLSKQWFVRMSHFKPQLSEVIRKSFVKLIPHTWESTYFHWVDHLRDWCISRQLWWGHRIPIWYRKDNPDVTICFAEDGLPPEVQKHPEEWRQDDDVLDTWFSSALWPMSTLGWPDTTDDFKKFYPTSTLVTGHDILFFWVARMMMMGQYGTGKPPFADVCIHGLIYGKSYWKYDEKGAVNYVTGEERLSYDLGKPVPATVQSKWEKMSKSKGNILDPLEIIDSFGTDGMRLALCASATQLPQIDLDRRRFEEFKNFANKIWNGARFVFMHLESLQLSSSGLNRDLFSLEDRWMLSVLNRTSAELHDTLNNYQFDKAAVTAYDFFWKQFCAYYVELVKPVLFGKAGTPEEKENKQKLLLIVLTHAIRLMHPMAPFITEELFQRLKERFPSLPAVKEPYLHETIHALKAAACAVAPYPQVVQQKDIDLKVEEQFDLLDKVVHSIRLIRGEMQISPGTPTDLTIVGKKTDPQFLLVSENLPFLKALVRLGSVECTEVDQSPISSSTGIVGNLKLIIPVPQELKEKEKARLLKEQERLIKEQNGARERLSNPAFVEKAPPALVEKLKSSLAQTEQELLQLSQQLKAIT